MCRLVFGFQKQEGYPMWLLIRQMLTFYGVCESLESQPSLATHATENEDVGNL